MDDPGTLIYIAFLVISLIAGWWKNKKKKEGEVATPTTSTQDGVLTPTNIDIDRLKEQAEEQQRADAEARRKLEMLAEQSKIEKPEKKRRKPLLEEEPNLVPDIDASIMEDIHTDFDARKAIIYNEILKRPYA